MKISKVYPAGGGGDYTASSEDFQGVSSRGGGDYTASSEDFQGVSSRGGGITQLPVKISKVYPAGGGGLHSFQ